MQKRERKMQGKDNMTTAADVLVIGAGFAGLYAVHMLRNEGFSVIGVEAGDEVGGTWYWNRYPGARCDIPSLAYSYTWSPELRRDWRWSEKYATQPEILKYINHVADRFDLRSAYRFNTRVQSAVFDSGSAHWRIMTDTGEEISARFVLLATGNLSVPNTPRIEGLGDFAGPVYHTGRWPKHQVDFSGLRVGVVGTGSSGVQAIPLIAQQAQKLVVFQRTPNFSVPAHNGPLTEEDHREFERNFPQFRQSMEEFGRVPLTAYDAAVPSKEEQWKRYSELWERGGASFLTVYPNLLTNREVNEGVSAFVREKIRSIVKDPETAEALCGMTSPFGVKRVCIDSNYFQTFNRPNVRLVNLRRQPIERVTRTGVQTVGEHHDFDALVLATGYDAMTGAILAIDIRGKDGRQMRKSWENGPRSYLGLMVAGYPNLFTITGPGSPSVIGNVLHHGEHHIELVTLLLLHARTKGKTTIDVQESSQDEWMQHVQDVASKTLFPSAHSWYLGSNIPGKPRVFMPYVGEGYRKTCAAIVADGYRGFRFE